MEQAIDAFHLMVMDGFAIGTPLLIQSIVFRLNLFVQFVDFVAGAIEDTVEGGDLRSVEFDRSGKIVAAINASGQTAGPPVAHLLEHTLPKLLAAAEKVSALVRMQK